MSIGIGYARIQRQGNFLSYSRAGLLEGQAGKGYYRNFDQVRGSILNIKNTTNRAKQRLTIVHDRVDSRLYSPTVLNYIPLSNAEYIEKGALRQVLTESHFTDISQFNGGFTIRIWPTSQLKDLVKIDDLYVAPIEPPISEFTFSNPDFPAENNRLLVTRNEVGRKTTKLYDESDPDKLITKTYEGLTTSGQLLETLEMTYSERGARVWDYTIEKVVKRAEIVNGIVGSLKLISHTKERYEDFSLSGEGGDINGKRLMELIVAPGSTNPQVTSYDYYNTPNNEYTNGRLKSTQHPDGSWEYWEYTDSQGSVVAVETRYTPWKDSTLSNYKSGLKRETTITPNQTDRVLSVGGVVIGKERFTTEVDAANGRLIYTQEKWDGSEWHPTISCFTANTDQIEPSSGRPICTVYPDGTAVTYGYQEEATEPLQRFSVRAVLTTITERRGELQSDADVFNGELTIVAGIQTVKVLNEFNQVIEETVSDIETGLTLNSMVVESIDEIGRPLKTVYNGRPDDYREVRYDCCGISFERNRNGAITHHSFDGLRRQYKSIHQRSSSGPKVITKTDFSGLNTRVTGTSQDVTLLVSDTTRSLNGLSSTRLSPDADGDNLPETTTIVTVHSSTTGPVRTTTHPDLSISILASFRDGRAKAISGTQVVDRSYDYGIEAGGKQTAKITEANGTEFTTTVTDLLGRKAKVIYADGAFNETRYYGQAGIPAGSRSRIQSSIDADGVSESFTYNGEGERSTTTTSLPKGQEMVTRIDRDVADDGFTGTAYRTRSYINDILVSTSLHSGDGYRSKSDLLGRVSTSERSVPADGIWTMTSTRPSGVFSVSQYYDGLLELTTIYPKGGSMLDPSSALTSSGAGYDGFGRVITKTDARTGTCSVNGYLENGSPKSVSDPSGRTTTYTYDKMARVTKEDAPDSLDAEGNTLANETYTSYYLTGQTKAIWGDQTYAVLYSYDEQQRRTGLRTYQSLAHGTEPQIETSGAALTQWVYHPKRGWLDKKLDADNKGCQYTYTSGGRLKTKTLARGIVITYTYDAGIMVNTDYSDSDTLDVSYQYDNFGRVFQVDQGENVNRHVYTYNPIDLLLDSETITYGLNTATPFVRIMDHSDRDTLLREKTCVLRNGPVAEHTVGKSYDTVGRLETITHGGDRVHIYNYVPNTYALSAGITSPEHSVINIYEPTRNVLDIKSNQVAGVDVSRYDYGVNGIGQRVTIDRNGSAFSTATTQTAGYNARGEVMQVTIPNQPNRNQSYNFDGIGNRTAAIEGAVETGFVPNLVNEYAIVGGTAQTHDDDGNLTDNGSLTFEWDAENRLISVIDKPSNNVVIGYKYDYQSRRIERNNSEGKTNWIYHGWNPCGQYLDGTLDRTYTWGTDLSGSQQGAGGVGGLLAVTDTSSGSNYYPTFDGNGNISEYLNEQQETVAHYEYDAFGNTVYSTGALAEYFEHRFSTKPIDEETGFYYYGYRYYDPVTGRWPSRDPIEEEGGINLYNMAENEPISQGDGLGLRLIDLGNISDSIGLTVKYFTIEGSYDISATFETTTCCLDLKIRGDLYGGIGFLKSKSKKRRFLSFGVNYSYRLEATLARVKLIGINVDFEYCIPWRKPRTFDLEWRIPILDVRVGANLEAEVSGGLTYGNPISSRFNSTFNANAWGKLYGETELNAVFKGRDTEVQTWLEGSVGFEANAGYNLSLDTAKERGSWSRPVPRLSFVLARGRVGGSASAALTLPKVTFKIP